MFTRGGPAVVLGLCLALASASHAAADEPFYRGKRVALIINFAAGGPTDIEGRLLAKHLVKSSTSRATRASSSRTWTARAA
jgi:putative tricarboxylic transport membrane protein